MGGRRRTKHKKRFFFSNVCQEKKNVGRHIKIKKQTNNFQSNIGGKKTNKNSLN
jgi:hypothetical protein